MHTLNDDQYTAMMNALDAIQTLRDEMQALLMVADVLVEEADPKALIVFVGVVQAWLEEWGGRP